MQPKDKNALPAKGRKAQGKAVRSRSFYTRVDYDYHFFAALGLIARRRWTQELRRMFEIDEMLSFFCEKEFLPRAKGFRNNIAGHPGEYRAQHQEQTVIGTSASSARLSSLISTMDRVASLLRMQLPPPPSLPRATPGICLTPRFLAQVPAATLAGR